MRPPGRLLAGFRVGGAASLCAWPASRVAWAQEGDGESATIRLSGLSYRPTHITVDRFEVELTNLDSSATYQVVVSSSNAGALGIGGCGTGSQTRTVTGVASQALRFVLYACAVDSGTVTAEVRRTGADTADASAGQPLTVVPIPDAVPAAERAARGAVPRVGTPGIVSGIHFDRVSTTSFRVKWSEPSDGDNELQGYGILLWTGHVEDDKPGYGEATTIGVPATFREDGIDKQAQTFTGLQDDETYHFLMHACNEIGCGHWSYPAKSQTTTTTVTPAPGSPDRPHTIRFTDITATSARVRWSAAANTGGVPLTGFDIKYWPYDPANPNSETGARTQPADDGNDRTEPVTGLAPNTEYEVKMRACDGSNRCSVWSNDHGFRTLADTSMPIPTRPTRVARPTVASRDAALYVSWTAPGHGGSAITHYDVQYRQGTSGPWTPANDVQAPARSTTIRQLTNGQAYQVQVRAVNAVGDGTWSDSAPGTPTTTVTEPGAAATMSVTPGNGQLTVTWTPPDSTGGAAITGYKVSWPGRVQSLEPTARRYTIPGLTNGQSYSVGVQACNDPAKTRCGDWTYQSDTPTAGVTRPGPVRSLTVTPDNRELALRWQAPSSNGGTAITGYEVGYKKRIESNWQSWTHSGTGTTATITDRLNGTLYDVRVRACNHSVGQTARCSAKWRTAEGTPEAPRPRNLDVVPLAWSPGVLVRRAAELTWVPVDGATRYQVQAQILGQADWHDARCAAASTGRPTQPTCVLDLDRLAKPGADFLGLHNHQAYALQVRMLEPEESAFSEPIVIIDTPIFRAKGASTRVEVSWRPVGTHSHINADGRYQLRYRRFLGDHWSVDWNPETEGFTPTRPTPLLPVGTTAHPISGLVNYGLYAIQLLYNAPRNNAPAIKVFAARDAYAWPSDRAAGAGKDEDGNFYAGERVGTFPLWPTATKTTYAYHVCSDTFPASDDSQGIMDELGDSDPLRVKARAFVQDAFEQWETATPLATGGSLITMKYLGTQCASYERFIEPIVSAIDTLSDLGETADEIRLHVQGLLESFNLTDFTKQDRKLNEVIYVDVPEDQENEVYFSEVSKEIGLDPCGLEPLACAVRRPGVDTIDILLYGRSFTPEFAWDIPTKFSFSQCSGADNPSPSLYATVVHEGGHALGISGTTRSGGTGDQYHHSQVEDSVMKTRGINPCTPTPFDVMALYALYQTVD